MHPTAITCIIVCDMWSIIYTQNGFHRGYRQRAGLRKSYHHFQYSSRYRINKIAAPVSNLLGLAVGLSWCLVLRNNGLKYIVLPLLLLQSSVSIENWWMKFLLTWVFIWARISFILPINCRIHERLYSSWTLLYFMNRQDSSKLLWIQETRRIGW